MEERSSKKEHPYISREEIEKQIKELKKGKASGEDNIQNEAWIHMQGETKEKTYELIRNVWKGEKNAGRLED